jgi:hypothetical protein
LALSVLLPAYTVMPSVWIVVLVALFAAGMAYLMAYAAVLKTTRPANDGATSA